MEKPTFTNETVCIMAITLIAITAMHYLGAQAESLVAALGGGLIGYLTRAVQDS